MKFFLVFLLYSCGNHSSLTSHPKIFLEKAEELKSNYIIRLKKENLPIKIKFSESFSEEEKVFLIEKSKQWSRGFNYKHEIFIFDEEILPDKHIEQLKDYLLEKEDPSIKIYKVDKWLSFGLGIGKLGVTFYDVIEKIQEHEYVFEQAVILINTEKNIWNEGYDFTSTFLHEIGHALGLQHSKNKKAVMYPTLERNESKHKLHNEDYLKLNELYANYFLDYWTRDFTTENYLLEDKIFYRYLCH